MVDISKRTTALTYPFLELPKYPNYKITEYGEVVSFYKRVPNYDSGKKQGCNGTKTVLCDSAQKLLEPHVNSDGYHDVFIKGIDGKQKIRLVHQLVLEAHDLPKPFSKAEVRHLDGNKTNNHISNIKWGTRQENSEDLARHGSVKGAKNSQAHLTEDAVRFIRENKHMPVSVLAGKFGVSKQVISCARINKTYQNVDWDRSNDECSSRAKRVNQFALDGTFIKMWNKMELAAAALGCCKTLITRVCKGKAKAAKGFLFKYVD